MFVPEALSEAYSLITPSEVFCRMAALEPAETTASSVADRPIPYPEGSPEWWNEWSLQAEDTSDAAEKIERRVYDALASGRLRAYVHRGCENTLYRIEQSFWRDDAWWVMRLSERLFSWDEGFDRRFADLPIFLRHDEVAAFLIGECKGSDELERTGDPGRRSLDKELAKVVAPPKVSDDEVTRWIVQRIDATDTQTNMAKTYSSAFPGRTLCHGREQLREIWRDEYRKRKNELVRPGPPRASR